MTNLLSNEQKTILESFGLLEWAKKETVFKVYAVLKWIKKNNPGIKNVNALKNKLGIDN